MAVLLDILQTLSAVVALLPGMNTPIPALTGYAEADTVRIGPEFSGQLMRVAVTRGSPVTAGEVLFCQTDTAERAQLAEAQARLDASRAQLANLLTGKRSAEIDVLTAQRLEADAQQHLSERQLARRSRLAASNVASVQDLDIAKADLAVARARVGALEAQIAVARLPAREAEIKAAEAQVVATQAVVDQSRWRLSQRTITAPVTARVEDILHWPGEQVGAAQPVVALIPPHAIKVRFYVPEALVGSLRPGAPVMLRCDGCGPPQAGHITFIASEAEYTPPVIYSTANRDKLVFLVEAHPDTDPERLHPGQPVDVTLETGTSGTGASGPATSDKPVAGCAPGAPCLGAPR